MRIHKRGKSRRRLLALLFAGVLAITGGTALATGAFAGQRTWWSKSTAAPQLGTVACADVGAGLTEVPENAKEEVDQGLAELDAQVADAYRDLAAPGQGGGEKRVMGTLAEKRTATLRKMAERAGADAGLPKDIAGLANCAIRRDVTVDASARDYSNDAKAGTADRNKAAGKGNLGRGFVDIKTVAPAAKPARTGPATGSFSSRCGRNENRHLNPDNVIVAPGVSNGAHHMHDYVGNKITDGFSSNNKLAGAGTTCSNGDQSTYYWPVLRLLDGSNDSDLKAPGGGKDRNVGRILQPAEANITFDSPSGSKVQPMTRFLRILTGDAKAFTNGPGNAHASWSCTGFEDRQLVDKYPICPSGSRVVRTLKFPDCWDGKNIDSANHRTHTAFSKNGGCPRNFRAIPQLVERVAYDVPSGVKFAVDSFPEQLHNPITDHGDFINVMNQNLLNQMVSCINEGRRCG
ncbi:DUF1996 domain-containing protein [Kitasatospora camelliae]|uniref:DUF1996 domain-containing protein n=1 Tax=Kitasatospora camelliae TaxID=3156397 RepID=A0AAU8JRF4_9ACTN